MVKSPCEINSIGIRTEKRGAAGCFYSFSWGLGGIWGPFKELYFEWAESITLTLSLVCQLFPLTGVCLGEQGSTQNPKKLSDPDFIISILCPQSITLSKKQHWCFQPDILWNRDDESPKGMDLVLVNNVHVPCMNWAWTHKNRAA